MDIVPKAAGTPEQKIQLLEIGEPVQDHHLKQEHLIPLHVHHKMMRN